MDISFLLGTDVEMCGQGFIDTQLEVVMKHIDNKRWAAKAKAVWINNEGNHILEHEFDHQLTYSTEARWHDLIG